MALLEWPAVTPSEAIDVLNRIHGADPTIFPALIGYRVPCNDAVTYDPTVQVHCDQDRKCVVGLLGLVNGLFGVRPADQYGPIAARYDADGQLVGFQLNDYGGTTLTQLDKDQQ